MTRVKPRTLVSKATTLPTEPQPLPILLFVYINWICEALVVSGPIRLSPPSTKGLFAIFHHQTNFD